MGYTGCLRGQPEYAARYNKFPSVAEIWANAGVLLVHYAAICTHKGKMSFNKSAVPLVLN